MSDRNRRQPREGGWSHPPGDEFPEGLSSLLDALGGNRSDRGGHQSPFDEETFGGGKGMVFVRFYTTPDGSTVGRAYSDEDAADLDYNIPGNWGFMEDRWLPKSEAPPEGFQFENGNPVPIPGLRRFNQGISKNGPSHLNSRRDESNSGSPPLLPSGRDSGPSRQEGFGGDRDSALIKAILSALYEMRSKYGGHRSSAQEPSNEHGLTGKPRNTKKPRSGDEGTISPGRSHFQDRLSRSQPTQPSVQRPQFAPRAPEANYRRVHSQSHNASPRDFNAEAQLLKDEYARMISQIVPEFGTLAYGADVYMVNFSATDQLFPIVGDTLSLAVAAVSLFVQALHQHPNLNAMSVDGLSSLVQIGSYHVRAAGIVMGALVPLLVMPVTQDKRYAIVMAIDMLWAHHEKGFQDAIRRSIVSRSPQTPHVVSQIDEEYSGLLGVLWGLKIWHTHWVNARLVDERGNAVSEADQGSLNSAKVISRILDRYPSVVSMMNVSSTA